jgi:hypothetical protein
MSYELTISNDCLCQYPVYPDNVDSHRQSGVDETFHNDSKMSDIQKTCGCICFHCGCFQYSDNKYSVGRIDDKPKNIRCCIS